MSESTLLSKREQTNRVLEPFPRQITNAVDCDMLCWRACRGADRLKASGARRTHDKSARWDEQQEFEDY